MRRLMTVLAALLVLSASVAAQQIQTVRVLDPATKANVDVGDAANNAVTVTSNGQDLGSETTLLAVAATMAAVATSLDAIEAALAADAVHGNAVISTGPQITGEAKSIAGGLENAVTVGQAARLAVGTSGQAFMTLINEAGTTDLGAAMLTALQLSDNLVTAMYVDEETFTPEGDNLLAVGFMVDDSGTDAIQEGEVGIARITPTRLLRSVPTGYLAGGATVKSMKSDNTDNDDETTICDTPCTVYSITAFNHAATAAFLRCENEAASTPGTETWADGDIDMEIPGSTTGAGFTASFPVGLSFSTALTCWIATGEAYTNAVDAGVDDVTVTISRVQ